MKKPTRTQITAEIAALEKAKTYVPRYSIFGEDNHAKITRQIEYLLGDLDPDDDDQWNELSESEQSAVLDAQQWMDGDLDQGLAEGWDSFKPKGK